MAISGHESRSETLFRKAEPLFFRGGPKPEKKPNPHEDGLRKALMSGNEADIATVLTSYIAAEIQHPAIHRPPDKYVRAGMLVAQYRDSIAPDALIKKLRELLK